MNAQVTEIIIAVATFFFTTIANAIIIGMFFGSMRTEMRSMSLRLATIEGMFRLVPRSISELDKSLSLGMVRNPSRIPFPGIPAHRYGSA